MVKKINFYSRKYEIDFDKGVYDKIAHDTHFEKISGEAGDLFLIRGSQENLILIERNFKTNKEIIKIHAKDPKAIQSQLEKITQIKFSEYRTH